MVAGSLSETMAYTGPGSKKDVEDEFEPQIQTFMNNDVDFVIAEVNIKLFVEFGF